MEKLLFTRKEAADASPDELKAFITKEGPLC